MAEFIDITKLGAQNYRDLQEQNSLEDLSVKEGMRQMFGPMSMFAPTSGVETPVQTSLGNWGESRFDESVATGDEINHLKDIRAENQPWIAKLGAGITKGVVLAGTTFADGTIGLVYGLGNTIGDWAKTTSETGASWNNFTSGLSKLWDNDVSNALAKINDMSEKVLPNYRTEAEENNPWYRNLGTMNFWADSFIKNLGFTVGAYYSGAAWTKALRGMGLLKQPLATEILGSTLSAINEGRIEANNNVADWKELQITQLQDQYQKALQGLNPDDLLYNTNRSLLQQNYEKQLQDIENRASNMGNLILLANSVLLSYNNFKTYGKLYSMGYRNAEKNMAGTAAREMSERVSRTAEGKYLWNAYTRGEGIRGGLKTGLREGLEEMNQAWVSETFGNTYKPDSPDAYYNALLDADADIQTSDFLTAATRGFVNTYGSGQRWEEFIVGGLTGLLGMPTFGKMNNSGTETYLGKGKVIGLSGGVFGEIAGNNARNMQGQSAVDIMNNYANKIKEQKDYFVQGQSFTNAMDGWSAEGNAFEYKNAEDNDDFSAIAAFARVGKLSDLKDMVNQDFETFTDEDLDRIAKFTSKAQEDPTVPAYGGWRTTDGKYMSESPEGRETMRQELSKKRDKILKNIDSYEESVELVRGLVHDSPQVTEDQINELAWLHWKIGRFTDRFNELKSESAINDYIEALNIYKGYLEEDLQNQIDEANEDLAAMHLDEYENASNTVKSINGMLIFLNRLQNSKNPFEIAAYLEDEDSKKFFDTYFGEKAATLFGSLVNNSFNSATLQNLYDNLKDLARISTAAKNFNERLKEFTENPESILTTRQKLENKAKQTKNNKRAEKLTQQLVNDFDGTVADYGVDAIQEILNAADNLTDVGLEQVNKIANLVELQETKNRLLDKVLKSDAEQQIKNDATTLLNSATTLNELTDLSSTNYNDISKLYSDEDPSLQNKSNKEQEYILTERLDKAKTLLQELISELSNENSDIDNIPTSVSADTIEQVEETGDDATPKVEPVVTAGSGEIIVDNNDLQYFVEALDLEQTEENINNLKSLIQIIKPLIDKQPYSTIEEKLRKTESWDNLAKAIDTQTLIATVFQFYSNNSKTTINPLLNAEVDNIDSDIKTENNNSLVGKSVGGIKMYWTSGQSSLPIHIAENSEAPLTRYYNLVNTPGYEGYTPEQVQYIQAVGKYLEKHGAWQRIDNGLVKINTEIHFATDPELNKEANAFVILLIDADGNVLGNLYTETNNDGKELDKTAYTYGHLNEFRNRFINEYNAEDRGSEKWIMPDVTTHIDKWMIGHVIYGDKSNMLSVQEIFTTEDSNGNQIQTTPIFAIAATDRGGNIRIVRDSSKRQDSTADLDIVPPLVTRNGQPYVLLPTGSTKGRKYVCVPVQMKTFDSSVQGPMREAIRNKLIAIYNLTDNDALAGLMNRKEALESLLGTKFTITAKNGTVSLKFKNTDNAWQNLLTKTSEMSAEDAAQMTLMRLESSNIPIQMSLRLINKTYEGDDYNKLIAPYVQANLIPEETHTIGNWFTINAIDKNGKEVESRSPKSTRNNPHVAPKENTPSASEKKFIYNKKEITVDVNNWDKITYIQDGEVKESLAYQKSGKCNESTCKALANCYGQHLNLDMTKPYSTKWGMYNPVENRFLTKQEEIDLAAETMPANLNNVLNSLEGLNSEKPEEKTDNSSNTAVAKSLGFLSSKAREDCWNSLSERVQKTLIETSKETWEELFTHYNAKSKRLMISYPGSTRGSYIDTDEDLINYITTLDGASFRLDDGIVYKKWNEKRELSWLHKALPNLATEEKVRIIRGVDKLTTVNNPNGAWGRFKNGIILIAEGAARGTLYHEAFHAVTHTLLTNKELQTLYDEGTKLYPNLKLVDVEERLAESFRRYVQYEEIPVVGKIVRLFRTLKHIVQSLTGKESVIDNLFYRINRGKLADKTVRQATVTRNRNIDYDENLDETIQELDRINQQIDKLVEQQNNIESTDKNGNDAYNSVLKKWKDLKTINRKVVLEGRTRFGDYQEDAENMIKKYNLSDVAYADTTYAGLGTIEKLNITQVKQNAQNARVSAIQQRKEKLDSITAQLETLRRQQKLYEDNLAKKQASEELLEQQEIFDETGALILRAGLERTKFANLTSEQQEMIKNKNLTEEEYNKLTLSEREQMLHCM